MNKTVILKDREGNNIYPKTTFNNVVGLPTILANGTKVYFGSGQPTTDATAFDDIDNNSLYLDTSIENKSAMLYRVDSISNNVITWDPYKYIADTNIQILGNKISFIPDYSIGDEVTYDTTGNGAINHVNGHIDTFSTGSFTYKKKSVSIGETYEVRGVSYNHNRLYSALTFLDSDNKVIGYYPEEELEESNPVLKRHIITISNPNIAYIIVNGNGNNNIIREATAISLNDFINENTEYLSEKPALKNTTELADAENGLFNWAVGGINTQFSGYVHASIDVNPGETYYIGGGTYSSGSQFRVIALLDKNGDVIETYPKENISGSKTYQNLKYTIKNSRAVRMMVNGQQNTLSIKRGTQISIEEYISKTDPNYLLNFINMANMIKRIRESGGKSFNWGPFDGGYMTITFDDGNTTLGTVSSILNEYNIPLCAAVPPRNLYLPVTGRTIKDMCDEIVANGGEILAHEFNPLTDATDYDNIKRIVMDSKNKLTEAGFNVRGLMKPGGTNAISWKNNNLQRFTQMFYDYADVCGDDPQYYSGIRHSLADDISVLKGKVDDAIANNKWISLVGHTINSPTTEPTLTEAHLREFIEYAIAQGIQFKTYAYMYDNFGNWN